MYKNGMQKTPIRQRGRVFNLDRKWQQKEIQRHVGDKIYK